MPAISVRDVSKRFTLHHERPRSLQELAVGALKHNGNGSSKEFWALKDVSFQVQQGETLALIGENGSGKSTLLKLIARILVPTRGQIEARGRMAALLELGAGFHPDLTGRDNIYLNGSFLGLGRREMSERFGEIVSFAELERFIDVPLKHYSSGMQVRLGFAIATSVDPDILLIDEVLAVGDESFQHKCLDRIDEFRARDKTIVLVSHNLSTVIDMCDRAVLLEDGRVRGIGLTRRIVDQYLASVGQKENEQLAAQHEQHMLAEAAHVPAKLVPMDELTRQAMAGLPALPDEAEQADLPTEVHATPQGFSTGADPAEPTEADEPTHWGSGDIRITDVRLVNSAHESTFVFQSGEPMSIQIDYEARIAAKDVVFGVGIYRNDGIFCYGTNTEVDAIEVPLAVGCGTVQIEFDSFAFIDGSYSLDVAIHTSKNVAYDYYRGYCTFAVRSRNKDQGVFRPAHRWRIGQQVAALPAPETLLTGDDN